MQVIIQDSDFLHPKKYWYKTNLLLIHQFMIKDYIYRHHLMMIKEEFSNHLVGAPVVKVWDQDVCSPCDLRFKRCSC